MNRVISIDERLRSHIPPLRPDEFKQSDSLIMQQVIAHGAVYCIGQVPGALVKIGWSRNPWRRLAQLQTSSSTPLKT